MFWCLTILTMICVIYCIDVPIVSGVFSCLVNKHDSMLYGVGLSIIAAYIFYIIQNVLPMKLREKNERKFIVEKLTKICEYMEANLRQITGDKIENVKEDVLLDLLEKHFEQNNIFLVGSGEFKEQQEMTIIECAYEHTIEINEVIKEMLYDAYLPENVRWLIKKVDYLELSKVIKKLYTSVPGYLKTITPNGAEASVGICLVNIDIKVDIFEAVKEYIKIYNEVQKELHK